jgi:hypothetical protein
MRKTTLLLTAGLWLFALLSLWLHLRMQDQVAENAELRAQLARSQRSTATTTSSTFEVQRRVLPPRRATSVAEQAAPPPNASPTLRALPTKAQVERMTDERRLLQQPKYREAWRAQQRLNYAVRRENAIRLLAFSPEQADAVVELEIERHLRAFERAPPNPLSQEHLQEQAALEEQDELEYQTKLRELLGDDGRARYQEYMESRATRMQVDRFRPRFTGADALRDDQVEPLIAALHVERAQMQKALREFRDALTLERSPGEWQRFRDREIEELKAAHDRMHAAVAPILSRSQLETLDGLLKAELARTEMEHRLRRMQFGAKQESTTN